MSGWNESKGSQPECFPSFQREFKLSHHKRVFQPGSPKVLWSSSGRGPLSGWNTHTPESYLSGNGKETLRAALRSKGPHCPPSVGSNVSLQFPSKDFPSFFPGWGTDQSPRSTPPRSGVQPLQELILSWEKKDKKPIDGSVRKCIWGEESDL